MGAAGLRVLQTGISGGWSILPSSSQLWDEPAGSHRYLELVLQLEGPLSSPFLRRWSGKVPPSALCHRSAPVTSPVLALLQQELSWRSQHRTLYHLNIQSNPVGRAGDICVTLGWCHVTVPLHPAVKDGEGLRTRCHQAVGLCHRLRASRTTPCGDSQKDLPAPSTAGEGIIINRSIIINVSIDSHLTKVGGTTPNLP